MAKFTSEQLLNFLYTKRLPQVYRQADIDAGMSLKRFIQAIVEGGFAEAITLTDGITDLTDPLKCPDDIFPCLFESFGYTYSKDIPIKYQRKILQNHGELFQKRGTIEYVYILTRILTGFECNVEVSRDTNSDNNVRVITITMFVDNSVTSTESQYYITLVKRFVKDGFIPFYLDVETNIVVDVVDIEISQQYLGKFINVEGIIDASPIEQVNIMDNVSILSPTLENEPFTKFNICGYSRIVPKYNTHNMLNPITSFLNVKINSSTGIISSSGTSYDVYTDYIYVPRGNILYFTRQYVVDPMVISVYVFSMKDKTLVGVKSINATNFNMLKAQMDLSSLLVTNTVDSDYYIRIGIMSDQTYTPTELSELLCVGIEDSDYEEYSATTRFKYDNEYCKNGIDLPIYMVDINDANGSIHFPYVEDKEGNTVSYDYSINQIGVTSSRNTQFIAYTDCNTSMVDNKKYYIAFTLGVYSSNTLSEPILTALCNNGKGTIKEVRLKKVVFQSTELNLGIYRCAYTLDVPEDFIVVRIKYLLCNALNANETAFLRGVICYECSDYGVPYIDNSPQPYVQETSGFNDFKNNLSIGLDGIALLSHNNSNGEVIARDVYDVLNNVIYHYVGVTYDSLGNPTSTYALPTPIITDNTTDLNENKHSMLLKTFKGKTLISMSHSIPQSRYNNTGGSLYHSCFDISTRIIK